MGLVPNIFFWSFLQQQIPWGEGFLRLDPLYIELFSKSIKQLPSMGVERSIESLGIIKLSFVNKFFNQLLHCFRFGTMGFHINGALYGWQGILVGLWVQNIRAGWICKWETVWALYMPATRIGHQPSKTYDKLVLYSEYAKNEASGCKSKWQ